jgi:hypothetical protein
MAVSRVLISSEPSSSTPISTGESCGEPSRRSVASTPRWFARTKSRTSSAVRLIARIYSNAASL